MSKKNIRIKKDQDCRFVEIASEITKFLLNDELFNIEPIVDGFLYKDKYIAKENLEIDITINIYPNKKVS